VDPDTGVATTAASAGSLFDPFGVAVERGGGIIIGDVDAFGFAGAVFRVDPATGAQTTVSRGGVFVDPGAIAVEAGGAIVVADPAAGSAQLGAVIRVDPATGAQTALLRGLRGQGTAGITVVPARRPLSKDDCKNGGWRDLGFRNQGQCVRSVAAAKPKARSPQP
jgi:hypothetical protein